MRVVLYARENLQGRARLAKQLKALRNYCARRGWKVVGEYSEVGDAKGKGSQLRAMLAASRQGKFTHIVVHDLARLSRSVESLLDIIDDLTQQEIELVTTDGFLCAGMTMSQVIQQLLCTFNQYQRAAVQSNSLITRLNWHKGTRR